MIILNLQKRHTDRDGKQQISGGQGVRGGEGRLGNDC